MKRRLLNLNYFLETRRGDYKAEKASLGNTIKLLATLKEAAQACASCFIQIPGVAKKDTTKLFLSKEDGGFFDSIFTHHTTPEQLIMAIALMRTVKKFRSKIEETPSIAPAWLPHSDFFLAALFFQLYFDIKKVRDKTYLSKFSKWLISDDNHGEPFKYYEKTIKRVNKVVVKKEKVYGYSHPKYFKTQIEYESSLKKAFSKTPKQFSND